MRQRTLLSLVFALFALVLLGGTLIPFGFLAAREHEAGYRAQRLRDTHSVADSLRGRSPDEQRVVITSRYPVKGFTAGWLLDARGTPRFPPTSLHVFPHPSAAPEIGRAAAGPDATRVGPSRRGDRLYVAVPIIRDGRLESILWISSSLRPVHRLDRATWTLLAALGGAGLALAVVVARVLGARLARRVEVLQAAATRFGDGRLDDPIRIRGRDELAVLAQNLNQMAADLSRLREHDRRFVAGASHQIRSPLTAIRLRVDGLAAIIETADDDVTEHLEAIAAETDRLRTLTSRLLNLEALRRSAKLSAVDVEQAVRHAFLRLEPVARRKGVSLIAYGDGGVVAEAPEGALDEILLNLVDNAVKHAPPSSAVDVRWTCSGGVATIRVRDRGAGIAPRARPYLFEPFFQADPRTPGHGLGLSISRELCARAGGDLTLSDADGPGAEAVVTWPVARKPATAQPLGAPEPVRRT